MFLDPLETVSVSLPPGWAFDAVSSSLTRLVFLDWSKPTERQIFLDVYPSATDAGASDHEWEAKVRSDLPRDATRVDRRDGPFILVERPGREGRPDQRWAIRRGPRLDVTVEHVGAPLGGALLTPELAEALNTIDVTANRSLGEPRRQADFQAVMESANQLFHAGDQRGAVRELTTARDIAKSAWLYSLVGRSLPEVPAAVAAAEALLALTTVANSALFLHQATLALYRCRGSLATSAAPSTPVHVRKVDALLQEAFRMHGELAGEQPPHNPFYACLLRSRILLQEAKDVLQSDQSRISGPWAVLAVEEAMTAAAYAGRGLLRSVPEGFVKTLAAQGITDEQKQIEAANHILLVTALDHQVAAGGLSSAARAAASLDQETGQGANWLLAARRLVELSPSPERDRGLVLAINGLAGALVSLGDDVSLADADVLLKEAQVILNRLGDESELRGQICLNQAWLRHYRRETEGSVALLDRAIECAKYPPGFERLNRAARSLRSQFLAVMGRQDEALADARAALDGAREALSTNHLNLAIVLQRSGDSTAALEQLRAGLAAAVADDPVGAGALRLLFVAAAILEPLNTARSLATTEAAEAVLDVLRRRVGNSLDRIGFDDAIRHREVASTLVRRRLNTGDFLAALATADRHRARSLATAVGRPGTGGETRRRESPGPPPLADAAIEDQVSYIARFAEFSLALEGIPRALDGESLVDVVANAGRTSILLHPSNDDLLIFVVRPGSKMIVATATAAVTVSQILKLTDALRSQLGIVVATRSARGEAPTQSIEDLKAALADDEMMDDTDVELSRLRHELHDALFSEVLPLLQAGEPIAIVPYRELTVIPISVLIAPDGRCLVDQHPVSVLPSLASLKAFARPGHAPPRAVIVGDPAIDSSWNLGPLPGAEAEARHVAERLETAGVKPTLLLHREATEMAFRTAARGARIIHLACHATVRQQALASPLFFTPEPPDDGLMLPGEIADLRFDGALVVLAACQSGLGRATADGVLGLGRAFVQAGARVVVLSLWRVSDAATAHLMSKFYDALLGVGPNTNGSLDVAAAVRHAQISTRETVSAHPSAWGPWIVVGDGGWRLH